MRALLLLATIILGFTLNTAQAQMITLNDLKDGTFTMDGNALFEEPRDLEPWKYRGRILRGPSVRSGRLRLHLDMTNDGKKGRYIGAISGGDIELNGLTLLSAKSSPADIETLLGQPTRQTELGGAWWHVQEQLFVQYLSPTSARGYGYERGVLLLTESPLAESFVFWSIY